MSEAAPYRIDRSAQAAPRAAHRATRRRRSPTRSAGVPLVALASAVALAIGWQLREERYLTPEEGVGYGLGVAGLGAMLLLLLYSLRKRTRRAQWGRMSAWLDFHIFTGLVGPYLVLLHSSWKFNGLAGIVMLLTVVIVASGFIGRYIYTAVPRTADGAEVEAGLLRQQIAQLDNQLQDLLVDSPESTRSVLQRLTHPREGDGSSVSMVLGRAWSDIRFRREWKRLRSQVDAETRDRLDDLSRLIQRRRVLDRQVSSLATARRMLALWHAVHIPIGMVLFTAAFIHSIAAVYYATLLR